MRNKRIIKIFLVLSLLPLAGARAQSLAVGRHANTATLLPDGRTMVAGGVTGAGNTATNTVEIYFTSAAAWGTGKPMNVARSSHTATLLPNGRVLVAGGFSGGVPINSAEIYNPVTGNWTDLGAVMGSIRGGHTATLLNKGLNPGKVLLCGGQHAVTSTATNTCEFFAPAAEPANGGTFSAAASMTKARIGHTASGIKNGKVFVAGGTSGTGEYLAPTEMYDAMTNTWSPKDSLNTGRTNHTATALNNGNIIISGGYNGINVKAPEELAASVPPVENDQDAGSHGFVGNAEMFSPEGGRVQISGIDYGVMPYRVNRQSAVLSPSGKQHLLGGFGNILPTLYSGPSELSAVSFATMSAISSVTASLLPASMLTIDVKQALSRTVNGRIVDGDLFLRPAPPVTNPVMEVENLKIWMVEKTTATLDGSPVGHEITAHTPQQPAGQFWDEVTVKLPGGFAYFEPQILSGDIPTQNYVYISSIAFTPIRSGDPPAAIIPAQSSITINASFLLPRIYGGGRLSGVADMLNATINDSGNYYVVTLNDGRAQINSAPIAADGRVTLALYITNPAGFVDNTSLSTYTYLSSGQNASGLPIDGLSMKLSYTVDRVDLSGVTYEHGPSNMIIREMIFSDNLAFSPKDSNWEFNPESMGRPLFDFTSVVTPAADHFFIGGRNCETATPYADCIRTRPPVSAPTFTAEDYANVYVMKNGGKWPLGASLANKRAFHTSTVLFDGSVLTCGGSDGASTLSSCEMLQEGSAQWTSVSPMNYPRALHTATLLPNGTVLVAGGTSGTGASTETLSTAEIFYPDTRRWVLTSTMTASRQRHTANILPNGNVLVAGGSNAGGFPANAEIYVSSKAAWEPTGAMVLPRAQHAAVNTKDGNVVIIGGISSDINSSGTNSVERFDFASRTWTALNPMGTPRFYHSANLLMDGRILVAGGSDNTGSINSVEIFDGVNWTPSDVMLYPRSNHKSLLLPNGKLMVTGGESSGIAYNTTEGYVPDFDWWNDQDQIERRANHTSVLLKNNYILNIGGWDGAQYLNSTEKIYFSYSPDQYGLTPKNRNPEISSDISFFDRGQATTLISSAGNFHGLTEASGGGSGTGNSSFSNPRVYLQSVDIPTGFLTDMTTYLYTLYGSSNTDWEKTLSSITVLVPNNPGAFPYGWYHMRVAENGQFSEGHTVQITIPRPTGLPSAAVGTVLGTSSIQWGWNQGTMIATETDGYSIFSASNSVFISTAAFVSPAAYIQGGLAPNTVSSIKVGGYNTGGYGEFQKSTTHYTLASPPQSLTVTAAGFDTVILTWNPMGNSGITVYEVSASLFSNFSTEFVPIPFANLHTSTSATLSNLTPNVRYYFRVRAMNGEGFVTLYDRNTAPYVSTMTVGSINSLSGTPLTMSAINWSWNPALESPSYEVYDVTAGTTSDLAVFLGSTTASSLTQLALSTNTAHKVSVNAYVGTNKGPIAYSAPVYTLAVTPLPGVPSTFSGITLNALTLNWIANGNPPGTEYNITTADNSGFTAPVVLNTTGTSISLAGLSPNKQYFARMTAVNESGLETSTISLGSAFTLAQPPTNLRPSVVSMSGITLAWETGNNSASTWYEVRFTTSPTAFDVPGTGTVTKLKSFAEAYTGKTVSINGLLTGTTYYFDVAAMNGASLETAKVQCVPAPATLPGPSGAPSGSLGGSSDPSSDVTIHGVLPDGREIALFIPTGAFPAQTGIAISSWSVNSCQTTGIPIVAVEIFTQDNAQPQVPVTLVLGYYNEPAWAVIDSKRQNMVLGRYNPASNQCLPLDTTLTPGNRTITANLNHFSVFQLMEKQAASTLSAVRVYPNPFYTNRYQGFVTIDNLPALAKVKIYTLSGDKVWEGTAGTTGILTWNAVNKSNVLVGSGIYLAVIDSSAGKKVIKIAVER